MVPLDITGDRSGRLVALERAPNRGRRTFWVFRCDCGGTATISLEAFRSGRQKGCGCIRKETTRQRSLTHGHKVGYRSTPEIKAWQHAKGRCFNPKNPKFPIYGGRGITMCEAWASDASAFLRDMGPRPEGTTLDRIDANGNYEPGNCRWATPKEQASNRRMTLFAEINGASIPLTDFARQEGVIYRSLWARMKRFGEDAATAARRLKK